MTKNHTAKSIFLILILSLNWAIPRASQAQGYTIQDLGSNAWSYSAAHGINALGYVVGEYEPTNFFYVQAFLYENGTMLDVGHLSGTPYAIAYGINGTNAVVGESNTANATHAFLASNGTIKDLGTLGAIGGYSSAHAINGAEQIVGEASLVNVSVIHAVLYSGANKTDLGALGGDYSSASAINNSGIIVGESDIVELGVTNVHAFVYTNGAGASMKDLGTLGGAYSSAKGINDSGVIVGESETLVGGVSDLHAFIYRNGLMSDLGTLGGRVSSASAINTHGQVVGYATDTNETASAFLYNGSSMINLSELIPAGSGWTNLGSADAINDAGQIAGSGYLADGSYHAYLLTPAAPWLALASAVTLSNGQFQVTVEGNSGERFALLASSNLVDWTGWFTNTLSGTSQVVADAYATNGGSRYYRALLLP